MRLPVPRTRAICRTRIAAATGLSSLALLLAGGCSMDRWATAGRIARPGDDHVYFATTPQMLEQRDGHQPAPVMARYPDQAAARPAGTEREGVVRLSAQSSAAATAPSLNRSADEFQLTAFHAQESAAGPVLTPCEPRRPFDPECPPTNSMETIGPPLADLYPDEYLLDGGDRDTRVAHHTASRSGLDTEDTIAEFTDHTGALKMRASNRVAVYAPRFGTVRTVTGLAEDIGIHGAAGVRDALAANNLRTGNAPQESVQGSGPAELEGRNRVDGMMASQPPLQSVRADGALQNNKFETGHQGRAIAELQSFHQDRGPEFQRQVLNAVSWTRNDYPVITASTSGASELRATFKPEQYVGLEDKREPGTLCLIKLADRETAQPGDVITFTLKFRNTGDLDVTDVRIIDNLTPRLEYVQGSARIDGDHPGGIDVQPNGEGSSILTFTLDGPLAGHDEGEITFEARVR